MYLFESCPKTKKKEHTGQCDQYLKTRATENHKVMNPQGVKISVATRKFLFRVWTFNFNFVQLSVINIRLYLSLQFSNVSGSTSVLLLLWGKQDATSGKWRKSRRWRPSIEVEEINAKAVEERRKETPAYEGFERARKPEQVGQRFLWAKSS